MEIFVHDIKKYVGLVHPNLYLITCLFSQHLIWAWPSDSLVNQVHSPCPQGANSPG